MSRTAPTQLPRDARLKLLGTVIKPITAESENEPGTLQYQVSQGKDDPNEVRLWEEVRVLRFRSTGHDSGSVSS